MLRSLKNIIGYAIKAKDGNIGTVNDFYFDDENWVVRYLVDRTGVFFGRQVLISPASFEQADWNTKSFHVSLTKEQVKNSPDAGSTKPVSRQKEIEIAQYYKWPMYWGTGMFPYNVPPAIPTEEVEPQGDQTEQVDVHLRSMEEVQGYAIQAGDGKIGHLDDFIVDDERWIIRYVVVNTHTWIPGKKVLLARKWIDEVSWAEEKAYTDLTKEQIKESPEYDPSLPINRKYEARLYDFYGRPKYWA